MKKVRTLTIGLIALTGSFGLAQEFVVDQRNDPTPLLQEHMQTVDPSIHLSQEFVPLFSSIGFTDLILFVGFEDVSGQFDVRIYPNSLDEMPIGRSDTISFLSGGSAERRFIFSTPVSVTPGQTYLLEFNSDLPVLVGVDRTHSYQQGRLFAGTAIAEGYDMWFREGIVVVPEPNPFAIAGFGLTTLALLRRLRF